MRSGALVRDSTPCSKPCGEAYLPSRSRRSCQNASWVRVLEQLAVAGT